MSPSRRPHLVHRDLDPQGCPGRICDLCLMSVLSQPLQSLLSLSLPPAPPCVGRGAAGNSGLSRHFRVVRAWVWAVVGDTAGGQGPGESSGGVRPWPGQCMSAKWNPRGPIFKVICKAELSLCLCLRTPHFRPQPGKMWAVGASVASQSSSCSAWSLHGPSLPGPSPTIRQRGLCLGGETGGHKDVLDPNTSHNSLPGGLVAHH